MILHGPTNVPKINHTNEGEDRPDGVLEVFLKHRNPGPLYLKKGEGFRHLPDTPIARPSWLSSKDIDDYNSKLEKTGFTGGLNYYRALNLFELGADSTVDGSTIKVPVKFVVGNQDLTYNAPCAKDFIHTGGLKKYVPLLDEVVLMEGVAHFIHEERPREVTQLIHEFFQKFRGGSGFPQVARKSCCIM